MVRTAQEIWQVFYEQGEFELAAQAVQEAFSSNPSDDERAQLHAVQAWCHYRCKRYDQALENIRQAGPDCQLAQECKIYIRSYSQEHRDDAELEELATTLGPNVDAYNALMIRARSPDCKISHTYVVQLLDPFFKGVDPLQHNVKVANLLHNTARFFLDRARGPQDITRSIGLLQTALAHYGDTSSWHHRAAAHFWLSQASLKLGCLREAIQIGATAVNLWSCAVELDPNNETHKSKQANAVKYLHELGEKLSEYQFKLRKP